MSSCITNTDETTVIGYALDGFPIMGSKVATDKYLTTANLDECHGITSKIMLDGKPTVMYHYVMTQDFPYSASCFRGKPVSLQVLMQTRQSGSASGQAQQVGQHNTQLPQPPVEALAACSGKVTGTCQTRPGQTELVCAPAVSSQGMPLPQ